MSTDSYRNLISRYIADDLSLQDTEDLLEWLNADRANEALFKELQEAWDKTREYPESLNLDTRAAWVKVKRLVLNPQGEPRKKKLTAFTAITEAYKKFAGSISRRFW